MPVDAYSSAVYLLTHFDGVNGSTSFIGAGPKKTSLVPSGSAQISTAQSVFGGASAAFDGIGAYVTSAQALEFGLLDFTVECWFYISSGAGVGVILSAQNGGVGGAVVLRSQGAGGVVDASVRTSSTFYTLSTSAVAAGAWHHIALVRIDGVLSLYLDGVLQASTAPPALTLTLSSAFWRVGALSGTAAEYFKGYVDECRITNLVGRYSAGFTVPSAAFATDPVDGVPINSLAVLHSVPGPAFSCGPLESLHKLRDVEFGGDGQIVGTVKEKNTPDNTPLRRKVRLLRERDGLVVAQTWSDAATGDYAFRDINRTVAYTVISYDHANNYRAVIADNLTPDPMP